MKEVIDIPFELIPSIEVKNLTPEQFTKLMGSKRREKVHQFRFMPPRGNEDDFGFFKVVLFK
jgi:hypothetical protein